MNGRPRRSTLFPSPTLFRYQLGSANAGGLHPPGLREGRRLSANRYATNRELRVKVDELKGWQDAVRAMARSKVLAPRMADYVDRKSTRLNSSHANISYAVFC